MRKIKLIALDLDGTLLNSNKKVSERTKKALKMASDKGIYIVPSTGRFFDGMPQEVRDLDFIRYAITINGAGVFDRKDNKEIYSALIPLETSVNLMKEMDKYHILYDCYQNNWGWMNKELHDTISEYTSDPHYQKMIWDLRSPVKNLKEYIVQQGVGIQKTQYFTKDSDLKFEVLNVLKEKFPELVYTSSTPENIEINHPDANKGAAIISLAKYLNIDISETMAFGDGMNDYTMIKEAGIGVVMANGQEKLKEIADIITCSNDEDGVAEIIERYCL